MADDLPPIAQINVTPFVDVVLVLLVIFMVTAPMMLKETLGIQLPRAASGDGQKRVTMGVAVNKNGNILLNGKLAGRDEIAAEVERQLALDPQTQAVISADKEAYHGDVVRAIDWVKSAGLKRFALEIDGRRDLP